MSGNCHLFINAGFSLILAIAKRIVLLPKLLVKRVGSEIIIRLLRLLICAVIPLVIINSVIESVLLILWRELVSRIRGISRVGIAGSRIRVVG